MQKKKICGMTPDELAVEFEAEGIDNSIGLKIAYWVYKRRIGTISEIKNISKEVLRKISEKYEPGLFGPSEIVLSDDNTEKYLYCTEDGRRFEAVYIPDVKRKTLCVSCQAGCRMGCAFCMTGRYGFKGNLSAGEIVNQIICQPHTGEITHVVFMGMGEPMDNINEVIKACKIITAEWGISLSPRNVTVSTVGITPGIIEFINKSKCNLTLSLYSPFSEERREVIPSEKIYPFQEIIKVLSIDQLRVRRRLSIAYIMINGINDTDRHFTALRNLLHGTNIRVNLLPYNRTPGSIKITSTAERMQSFKHNLVISGIPASIRKSRGNDISAACGQLAADIKNI